MLWNKSKVKREPLRLDWRIKRLLVGTTLYWKNELARGDKKKEKKQQPTHTRRKKEKK